MPALPEPPSSPDLGSASWQMLDAFVQQLSQCVCVYSPDGRCLMANAAFCRWLGRERSAVIGQEMTGLWPDPFAAREMTDLRLVLESGRIDQHEHRPGARGPRRPVRSVKFPCHGPAGEVVGVVVVFDELLAHGLSPSRTEAVGRRALGIFHDLNNALMLLGGHLSRLEQEPGAQDWLARAWKALDHARHLPRQLLTVMRDEAREKARVDLNVLITSLEDLLRSERQGQVTFDYRLHPGGAWVEGDSVRLKQALLNLAGNALAAMPEGGRLSFETELVGVEGMGGGGSLVRISIRDTGPGITPEVQGRLFTDFVTTQPQGKGTGLGLTIVREVVEEHGGWVAVQSQPGQGARFVIHLPAASAPAVAVVEVPAPSGKILVIDSERDIRQMTCMILEHAGRYSTISYAEIPAALEDLRAGQPGHIGLVLVDVLLAARYGWETLVSLLDLLRPANLLLTTTGCEVPIPAAIQERQRGIVNKPFSVDLLLCSVGKALHEQFADAG